MSEVNVEVRDRIAVLTIDRPHARNAIGLATIDDLQMALDDVAQRDVSVLVITGGGDRAFVSGGDLKELNAIRDQAGAMEMAVRMRRVLDRLSTFPIPVIAAVNGHALGGGAEVAVACDIRVAAADVQIGFTQVKLAIMPAWGGAERLAEVVGRGRALTLVATGRLLTANEAAGMGLVDVVAERNDFVGAWQHLAEEFAAIPPATARSVKSVIGAARPHDHPHLEANAVERFSELWIGEPHWAAADAFMSRTSPR
ncbi:MULTISPECIES: enoyl-CoA hydratase/isomerase family protein [unclassified Nocardioides]|uniref:enoyl-CoA hydratase/isomerase family protein n=1 Tax=unclassified Nocardioides TaxID=2615069 RepID=UPI0006F58288|nr:MULTISPECIES: enoyl-CoA hydratase/isomerase family protein [unclassified Nocardioides]KRA31077.1 enoyl-CoA hydratase [Nocardioides sp. Root614]KRA87697.1 enoyl-CoA hydratase [Nocardioides sp. Root682]